MLGISEIVTWTRHIRSSKDKAQQRRSRSKVVDKIKCFDPGQVATPCSQSVQKRSYSFAGLPDACQGLSLQDCIIVDQECCKGVAAQTH